MYLNFYSLKEKPFNATPDPKFLYLSLGHREALAQLAYGVEERKGFVVVTGDVGTGKTTLLQALLQRLGGGRRWRRCEYAGGILRVINILCDHCLLFGYADRAPKIEREFVEQAIAYLQGTQSPGQTPASTSRRGATLLGWALGLWRASAWRGWHSWPWALRLRGMSRALWQRISRSSRVPRAISRW